MPEPPPHLFRAAGIAAGHAPAVVARASAQRHALIQRGSFPLLTLGHLAQVTGVSYQYLRDIVTRSRDPYTSIERPKRTGGVRTLSAPEPVLMEVQRWMLAHLLQPLQMHGASYAYQRDRSIMQCARLHVGARWLLKFDLHDFFPSVSELRVYRVYRRLGYSALLSLELSRISTRAAGPRIPFGYDLARYPRIRPYAVGRLGSLPQGAPTSGALANAVAFQLDQRLAALADSAGLVYTRYSDDLTLSSSEPLSRPRASRLIAEVTAAVQHSGFHLHEKKTRVVPPGARHVVLGLLLGETNVRLLPEFVRRIELHIRGVEQFGLTAHAQFRRFPSVFALIEHVDGCLAFAAGVDPDAAARLRGKWTRALSNAGYPINQVN